ncbi:hypothetical protein TNIN_252711 [Trichonephila inaurata madagascariensis]|uniref:Uncharacterized protein n=1 Tax=Trichonephila inaurata madagascariensis TaxID=2747483 RepID=A0A8X7CB59_9ARAC|nr:hypothetical protein TNIN_252711 [Trichonephila inaurata madagascariensis]
MAVGVYVEEGRGNRYTQRDAPDPAELPGSVWHSVCRLVVGMIFMALTCPVRILLIAQWWQRGVMAVGVYVEEGRGNRYTQRDAPDPAELPGSVWHSVCRLVVGMIFMALTCPVRILLIAQWWQRGQD